MNRFSEVRGLNTGVCLRYSIALAFAEPAPNAVGLSDRKCVFSALVYNRASCAYRFCSVFAGGTGASAFAFRVKEEGCVGVSA